MLVLTRKQQQQIMIGDGITVTILQVKGQSVRVGIQAPANVCVLRSELADKLARGEAEPLPPRGPQAPKPATEASPVKHQPRNRMTTFTTFPSALATKVKARSLPVSG